MIVLFLLLLKAVDIEMNPGPDTINSSLSIVHSNISSIRNKFDYITESFLDFDIFCFTESHLDATQQQNLWLCQANMIFPIEKIEQIMVEVC